MVNSSDEWNRNVVRIVETHSPHILLAIQTAVAKGDLPPEAVKLFWFERDEDGETQITPGELDRAGAYGDWPEDFSTVEMEAYLDAAENAMEEMRNG